MLKFIPVAIFIFLSIFLWKGLRLNPSEIPSPFINKPVPVFSLPNIFSREKNFTSQDLQGHVVLLNIFASWCISCKIEHPVWMDIREQKKILLYGIDYKDSREAMIKWLQKAGNPYQKIGFDAKGNTAINLGVYGTPETFLIDSNGIIRYKYIGPVTKAVWEEELKPEVNKLTSTSRKEKMYDKHYN